MGKIINTYLLHKGFNIIDILDENNKKYNKNDTVQLIIDFSS